MTKRTNSRSGFAKANSRLALFRQRTRATRRSYWAWKIEHLETRELLAANVYVNDNWVEFSNTSGGTPGVVETNDVVTNSADPGSPGALAVFNNPSAAVPGFATVQAAVDAVSSGGTVHVLAGRYVNNVVIDKPLHLRGEAQSKVTVFPAISNPHPAGAGSQPLPGGESNIVLVRASDVEISNITFNGDNPAIGTVPFVVDARNGVTTDGDPNSFFINLNVHDVTVINVYFRGIQNISTGTFNFTNNLVGQVQTHEDSIGIFNLGGFGTITDNQLFDVTKGIVTDRSRGTAIKANSIQGFASVGIGSYNNGPDGSFGNDVIGNAPDDSWSFGNSILSGDPGSHGLLVSAPALRTIVWGNRISSVTVGLALFGGGAGSVHFLGNEVSSSTDNSFGAIVSNEDAEASVSRGDTRAEFDQNRIAVFDTAILVKEVASETANTQTVVRFGSGSAFGNVNGLVLDGDVELTGDTLGRLEAGGHFGYSILLTNGAYGNGNPRDGQRQIDATSVPFGFRTGVELTAEEREFIETKIFHEPDDGSLGRVLIVPDPYVEVVNGQLVVVGDQLDNDVSITGIGVGTGVYRVDTGHISQTVGGVTREIVVNLHGGNDRLTINTAYVNGAILITAGNGDDEVILGNQDVVSTRTELSVDMGAGNDVLDGKRLYIGTNQTLSGGDGDDRFVFDGIASPQFRLGTSAAGNANWSTGNGDDTVHVIYGFIVGAFAVDMGDGSDSLDVFGSAVSGNVSFFASLGNDSLRVDTNFFDANLLLDGGADNDTIFLANGLGTDIGIVNAGAGSDMVTVRNETEGEQRVDTGSGDDALDIRGSAFDRLFAQLGDDNDQLTIFGNLSRLETDLDGGLGFADRLLDLGNDFRGASRRRGFELVG